MKTPQAPINAVFAYKKILQASQTSNILSASGRINLIAALINTRQRNAAQLCFQVYQHQQKYFLKDLFQVKKNEEFMNDLEFSFKKERIIRHFWAQEMAKLCRDQQYIDLIKAVQLLGKWHVLPPDLLSHEVFKMDESNETTQPKQVVYAMIEDFIMKYCVYISQPILAASLAIQLNCQSVVPTIIQGLCIDRIVGNEFNYTTILSLLAKFPTVSLGDSILFKMTQYLLQDELYPIFANKFFNLYLQNQKQLSDPIIEMLGTLMERNLQCGNLVMAIKLNEFLYYRYNKNLFPKITMDIIEQVHIYNEDEANRLASSLSKTHPEFLLKYYACNGYTQDFKQVFKQLVTPLSRDTLSSLFQALLFTGEQTSSDKILQNIIQSSEGIRNTELRAIVRALLEKDKFDEAFKLVAKSVPHISDLSLIELLKYNLENQRPFKEFETLVQKLKPLNGNSDASYIELMKVVLNYIVDTLGPHTAVKYYNYLNEKNNFVIPTKKLEILAPILENESNSKIQILNHFLIIAIDTKDRPMLDWVCKELLFEGITTADILDFIELARPNNKIWKYDTVQNLKQDQMTGNDYLQNSVWKGNFDEWINRLEKKTIDNKI